MSNSNNPLDGSVSFVPKSPDNFLSSDKHSYFSYQTGYDSADRSFHYGAWSLGYMGISSSYTTMGDPNLKTETSDNYELGLKSRIVDGATFSAAAFYSDYKNFIANVYYNKNYKPEMFSNIPANIRTLYITETVTKPISTVVS
ncbi:MAG: TonB-dependent receptor domain-containing protein [Candidatus Malihini olakiniferum]